MGKEVDLSGAIFGRLEAVKKVGSHKKGYAIWLCKCACGNTKNVRSDRLKNGDTRSCGCLMREKFTEKKIKHGLSNHRLYGVWHGMKQRCYDPLKRGYKNYGGRGISVCEEWRRNFKTFYDWCIINGWERGLEIDRIDNDGNYQPENCRFVTPKENCRNRGRK